MQGIREFERLALGNSPLHRRDPRAKLLVVLVALLFAASAPRYSLVEMLPLFFLPWCWLMQSGLSLKLLARKMLPALPFVLLVAIFNPVFDHIPVQFGPWQISAGVLSFFSILLRLIFSLALILLLVASTGFHSLCAALLRLRVPKILVVQLLLLYRYLFLLAEETSRMRLAYALRSPDDRSIRLSVSGSLIGHLLLRVMDRAQRIHQAMLCRGFNGDIPVRHCFHWLRADSGFLIGWTAWLVFCGYLNTPEILGRFVLDWLA